jgi:phosphatidylglycerophosphate synthase
MLDAKILPKIQPLLQVLARYGQRLGLTADQVSVMGFLFGMAAALAIAVNQYGLGLGLLLLSRLLDGVDGALARLTQSTDAGGFLDITLDFLFYASIPLAFAWAHPTQNALAACVLLAAFIGTGSSFLAFAVLAQKQGLTVSKALPSKSFYFLGGLTEGTETMAVFAIMCLWPEYFSPIAYAFTVLCVFTIVTRIYAGYQRLRSPTT